MFQASESSIIWTETDVKQTEKLNDIYFFLRK